MELTDMTEPVITIQNLGKHYRNAGNPDGTLWALRHVSLEIMKGEVWGIIGRNGAGKSTLLKLLSRVTKQSEGSFSIKGRVHSILELGMGFHVELNGIDNLYVAGSLQGMSRKSIRNSLNAIVEFSGLGEAVYQPLRTYSSGMRVRLAFSLAAHMSPDILILDEILAVGDEEFQRKCFEVIRSFIRKGVTVLFVSHDMKLISLICNRCVLLHNGEIIDRGDPETVIESYSRIMGPSISTRFLTLTHAGHYMQLFHRDFRITRRFGLYTCVRANKVWYDTAYVLWDEENFDGNQFVLKGHYITVPLTMTWSFRFIDEITLRWQIVLDVEENVHIDRFQVNVMLNRSFSEWEAGAVRESFPLELGWQTGEDWTRHWIGPADSVISAETCQERFSGRVEFTSVNKSGAMIVISSCPEFNVHMLQYLKTWAVDDLLPFGSYSLFEGTVSVHQRSGGEEA